MVEVDHVTWHGGNRNSQRDKWRDRQLRRLGIDTMRVSDEDVREGLAGVTDDIAVVLRTRLRGPETTESVVTSSQNRQSA